MSDSNLVKVSRALISVSDKSGIVEFASALRDMGVQLLSTGGTYRLLQEQGLEALDYARLRTLKRKGFADQRLAGFQNRSSEYILQ